MATDKVGLDVVGLGEGLVVGERVGLSVGLIVGLRVGSGVGGNGWSLIICS